MNSIQDVYEAIESLREPLLSQEEVDSNLNKITKFVDDVYMVLRQFENEQKRKIPMLLRKGA